MATKRITGALVEAMEPGQVAFDDTVRGFMVHHRGGSPRYALKTRIKGRQVILSIGRHGPGAHTADKARKEAQRLLGLIRDGKDPATDRANDKAAPSFADFAARYLVEYAEPHKKPRNSGRGCPIAEKPPSYGSDAQGQEDSGDCQGRCAEVPRQIAGHAGGGEPGAGTPVQHPGLGGEGRRAARCIKSVPSS